MCGIIDKHPGDKATRCVLSQELTKCEAELANLQAEYNQKLKAYRSVENSFAKKIEKDIMASDPKRYIVNGVKKLGSSQKKKKHIAILHKKCNGKLPPKGSVTHLLQEAVKEQEMKGTFERPYYMKKLGNPNKRRLEEEYTIRFPKRNSSTTSGISHRSVQCPLDFRQKLNLQDELHNKAFMENDFVPFSCANDNELPVGMYVPGHGWSSPLFENERHRDQGKEAAIALVELKTRNKK